MPDSRRAFLSKVGLTTAALANMQKLRADPLGEPVGLQLYTVSAELAKDFPGTIKQVAAIGYKEVELAPTFGKSAAELRTIFSDNGLTCRSAHMFDFSQTPAQFMDFAKEVGVSYVVTSFNPPPAVAAAFAGPKPDMARVLAGLEGMTLDDYKKSAETANQLGEEAKKQGLIYAYHNHNLEFKKFDGKTAFETLLASTDPETVKYEMDCGWVSAAGYDPVMFLKEYPNRIRLLHIKAFKAGAPSTTLGGPGAPVPTELGRGGLDYRPVFKAAAKANVAQYYVEQEPPFTEMTAMEAIEVDYEYLHTLKR
jgi:sugar phosphate isomerase/epimerase